MISREEALEAIKKKLSNRNLQKHVFAVEAIMQALAAHFGEDGNRWGMAGLLHDLDYEDTKGDPATHSLASADIIQEMGFDAEVVDAVRVHNDYHGLPRTTKMAKALYSVDPLTGLIVAAALISPQKKLGAIDADFVMKRFGEKAFARGARRDAIAACSEFGMELWDFVDLGVKAMQGISRELGL